MKITFFEAKDYDRVWFGENAREYGFEVAYVEEEFSTYSLRQQKECEIVCIRDKNEFSYEEIALMREKGVRGILILVDDYELGGRRGSLEGIPVVAAARFSPREAIQK